MKHVVKTGTMVEDHWRVVIPISHKNPNLAQDMSMRFADQCDALAASMPPGFLDMVAEEIDRALEEMKRDRAAFERRLGVPPAHPVMQ